MYHPYLNTFILVADCGSFRKASEQLFISSTAVIKQINSLESFLEMKLFRRTPQGVLLTEAGNILYQYAKKIIQLSDKALGEARLAISDAAKTLRIGTSLLNPCKPFMDIWQPMSDTFPEYKLQVIPYEDDHEDILTVIKAIGEKYDFLVGACDSKLWLNYCNFLRLGAYKLCCCVARNHRLSGKTELTVEDLFGETLMAVKEGDSNGIDVFRRDMISRYPQIHFVDTPQFYDINVFNQCERIGNVLLSLDCWREVHPSLVTIPVDWDYEIPFGLLYPLEPRPEIRAVIDFVRENKVSKSTFSTPHS